VAVAVDTPTRRQTERVAPELAVAKLELRDIALLAAYEILTEAEQRTYRVHYRRALAAGERIVDEHATTPDRPLPEIARLFFSFTWVFPNLGLAGPFFAGESGPLDDAVLLAARERVAPAAWCPTPSSSARATPSSSTSAGPDRGRRSSRTTARRDRPYV
jgi:hypothetical protein